MANPLKRWRAGRRGKGERRPFFPALREPIFASYTFGCLLCFTALWTQRTAVGWLTWQLTGSGLWLGLVSFAYLLPLVVLGPIGGAVADRRDTLGVIMVSQVILAAGAIALAVLSATDRLTVEIIIAIAALQGMAETFSQTSQLVVVPSLVPRRDLTAAVATMSVTFNLARFIGPAVGGALIATAGAPTAFTASVFGFLLFLGVLVVLRARVAIERQRPEGNFLGALRDGIRYTARHPGIGPMMMLVVSIGITGRPIIELLPGFAEAIYEAGPVGLATLTSSVGVGSILAGIRWGGFGVGVDGLTRVILRSTAAMALVIMAFVAAPNIYLAALTLVGVGYFITSTSISVQTLINLAVEDGMRGRVLSLFGVFFRGSPALGALIMGATSEFLGLRIPVLIGASLLLLCWLAFRAKADRLSRELNPERRDEA